MNLFLLYRWKNHAKFLKDFWGHRGSHLASPGAEARHGDSRAPAGRLQCIYPDPRPSAGKESTCNAGDPGLIPGLGKSPGEGIDYPLQYSWASLVAHKVKNLPAVWKTRVWSLGWEDPLEEGMTTHSSILAWRIPMDRGAWWAAVRGVAESDTTEQLSTHDNL